MSKQSKKIYGWVIIDTKDGNQWNKPFASKGGAKNSFNHDRRWMRDLDGTCGRYFDEQVRYKLFPLGIIEDNLGCSE